MLRTVLRLVGVDLAQKTAELKAHLRELVEGGTSRLNEALKDAGVTFGIALTGAIAALATIAFALAALFIWVDRSHGPLVALAAVGGVTACIAVVMFAIAGKRGQRKPRVPVSQPSGPVRESPSRIPSPPLDLSAFVSPPPSNASILDILSHRVSHRAAAASDEAIDAASEFVRSGSRGALLATLTVVGLVGVVIGRRTPQRAGPHP
jgi:hypothetical protein